MNTMYKDDSFCEKGTLKQLQNLLRRQRIPKDVKADFRSVNDFIQLLVYSHVVAAALEFFGLDSVTSKPKKNKLPVSAVSPADKRKYINRMIGKFVYKFVLNFDSTALLPSDQSQPGNQDDQTNSPTSEEDGVFNYACRLLSYGLMSRNFEDATKEGDGDRICRLYRFFMLHFKEKGRTKYAIEAFHLTAQISALLSPQQAHQLMWNRSCNTKGGIGKNKQLDLHNEHINRVFKKDVNTFRANLTEHSIKRSAQAIIPMMQITDHFDQLLDVKQDAGWHAMPDLKDDFNLVLNELQKERIFNKKQGRQHSSFPNFSSDPFQKGTPKNSNFG